MKNLLLTLALTLSMAACATAPATQSDADQAGRSRVEQVENNERGRIVLPRTMTITFYGNVGDIVLIDQRGDVEGDQGGSLSNQGSTTQEGAGATATQSPSAEASPKTDVTIPVK